jgi:predicted naringenin-chalcone synthase
MSFAILGMGTALPDTTITQDEGLRVARSLCCRTPEQATWLPVMYGGTGIDTRHLSLHEAVVRAVLGGATAPRPAPPAAGADGAVPHSVFVPTGEPDDAGPTTGQRMRVYAAAAPPLALLATRRALEDARLAPAAVTHLVTVSCTGFAAPGVDFALVEGLGLAPTVARTHVGFMGCHGAINGLRVAAAFSRADAAACVLLCATELCSLHYHYGWDPEKMVANALFADGAAAVVGGPAPAAGPEAWQVAATGSCLFPDSADAMTWSVGDHGFEMTLSARIPELLGRHLGPWLAAWLGPHGLTAATVASWAVHPGGPRILTAIEEALALPRSATAVSREVLAACGNMSSPTVLFILERLRDRGAPRPCVALGFGPGLVAEALLFR